jgi:hypothetical protein
VTRLLATFSEVSLIYQLAYVLRLLNVNQISWVDWLSWTMVLQVVVSQIFVWGSILTKQLKLFYYEELGWAFIYMANTVATIYLYLTVASFGGRGLLLAYNLIFGVVYVPWQFIHLYSLYADARQRQDEDGAQTAVSWQSLGKGLHRSIYVKNPTTTSQAWGGFMGIIWMTSYWATLIPLWAYQIIQIGGI